MPIPRFPSSRFPEFCQFRVQKKELALEMKNLSDFPYYLMHIRPFDEISMVKGNNQSIRRRYDTGLQLKLKNKCTETTLSNGVLLFLLLSLNVFFTKS